MAQRTIRTTPPSPVVVVSIGFVAIGAFVVLLIALMQTTSYDFWGAPLVFPFLIVATIPALRRQARREVDPRIFWILVAGLTLKLLGGLARYYQAFVLYEKGDARSYHEVGVQIADRFLHGNLDPGLGSVSPEDAVGLVTGAIYTVFRPSILIGFLVFSWLGFLGLFWFYKAFQLAVPEGRWHTYARLLFFLPSLLFWPSSIGKEAWMMFAIGLAAFGAARLLWGEKRIRGGVFLALGLAGAAWVRPHFAGILVIALTIAYLIRRSPSGLGQLGPLVKLGTAILVSLVAIFALGRAEHFFVDRGFRVEGGLGSVGGVTSVLRQTTSQTSSGGSQFTVSGIDSPKGLFVSAGTVLFRPLPSEAGNPQAVLTAVESSFLLIFSIARWRWILAALRSIRRQPYVAFMAAFAFGSILALSSIANFGILARERVLLLPAYLVFLSIPPPASPASRDVRSPTVASAER
jgi:hypothetical protein